MIYGNLLDDLGLGSMPVHSYSFLVEAIEAAEQTDLSNEDELPAGEKLRELAQVLNESVVKLGPRAPRVVLMAVHQATFLVPSMIPLKKRTHVSCDEIV